MTEAQAHKFVTWWKQRIRPRRIRTNEETVRELMFRLKIFTPITFLAVIGLAWFLACSHDSFHHLLPVVIAVMLNYCVLIFEVLNIFLLRQAHRILCQSQIANPKS
jgi:hypothetical protein